MNELLKRVIVAVIAIPVLVWIILEGSWYFFGLISIIAIGGQYEFYSLAEQKGAKPQIYSGILLSVLVLISVQIGLNNFFIATFIFLFLVITGIEMYRNNHSAIINGAVTFLGVVYPSFFLATLIFLRFNIENTGISSAGGFILSLFVAIWICDTFAYFIGKAIGKHKLFERVSPKKSMEGAIAGLFGALLVFLAVYYFRWYIIPLELALLTGIAVGIFGQFGDLVESWYKRDATVKDSSHILPGHGGLLDRFDSLIFVSPVLLIIYLIYISF
jgi:phosphatidate cytidylyltransferase